MFLSRISVVCEILHRCSCGLHFFFCLFVHSAIHPYYCSIFHSSVPLSILLLFLTVRDNRVERCENHHFPPVPDDTVTQLFTRFHAITFHISMPYWRRMPKFNYSELKAVKCELCEWQKCLTFYLSRVQSVPSSGLFLVLPTHDEFSFSFFCHSSWFPVWSIGLDLVWLLGLGVFSCDNWDMFSTHSCLVSIKKF